ncbi:MAG: hypothetical protein IGS03_11130 [Candidatus Sericytochromatia bacterium]|nr:hypothetical protein [Candidatus Sericytochromatia bacterium]
MELQRISSTPPGGGASGPGPRSIQSSPSATVRPAQSAAESDSFHFSLKGQTNGQPARQIRFAAETPAPAQVFGNAVHVDSLPEPGPKVFGTLSVTPSQAHQLKAAEARAFDRFRHAANNPERGSLQAKLNQAAMQQYQPGYMEHVGQVHITENESKEVMKALQRYGEDLASISITGRDRKGMQRYVEDRFFITLFDRDKDEFEDYFKGGVKDFFGDSFGNSQAQPQVQASEPAMSARDALIPLPDQNPEEQYKVRYLRPRLGVSIRGLDFEELKLRPKVDLVRVQGPAQTEVRVEADLPYKMNGEFRPEAHVSARRILNHKPGEYGGLRDNVFVEGRTSYEFHEQRVRATVGLNKQISPDESVGVYALYSQQFEGMKSEDAAIGVNYQKRWD